MGRLYRRESGDRGTGARECGARRYPLCSIFRYTVGPHGGHMRTRLMGTLFAILMGLVSVRANAQSAFTVGGVTAQPGTAMYGEIQVPARGADTGTIIPFSIVNGAKPGPVLTPVSYTHLRAHETRHDLVCRLLLEKKKKKKK